MHANCRNDTQNRVRRGNHRRQYDREASTASNGASAPFTASTTILRASGRCGSSPTTGKPSRRPRASPADWRPGSARFSIWSDADAATYTRAVDYLRPTGQALDFAAKEYAEAFASLEGIATIAEAALGTTKRFTPKLSRKLIPEIVKELLASRGKEIRAPRPRPTRTARTVSPAKTPATITNVTHNDVALWLRGLGLSPRSHDNYRQAIITLFRFARKWSYLPEGLTEAEKTEAMGDDGEGEIAIFSVDEMARLLKMRGMTRSALSGPWRVRRRQDRRSYPPRLAGDQFRHGLYRDQKEQGKDERPSPDKDAGLTSWNGSGRSARLPALSLHSPAPKSTPARL